MAQKIEIAIEPKATNTDVEFEGFLRIQELEAHLEKLQNERFAFCLEKVELLEKIERLEQCKKNK